MSDELRISVDHAVDFIFTELCKEGKPASEDDIRLVVHLFAEFIELQEPIIEVRLEEDEG